MNITQTKFGYLKWYFQAKGANVANDAGFPLNMMNSIETTWRHWEHFFPTTKKSESIKKFFFKTEFLLNKLVKLIEIVEIAQKYHFRLFGWPAKKMCFFVVVVRTALTIVFLVYLKKSKNRMNESLDSCIRYTYNGRWRTSREQKNCQMLGSMLSHKMDAITSRSHFVWAVHIQNCSGSIVCIGMWSSKILKLYQNIEIV